MRNIDPNTIMNIGIGMVMLGIMLPYLSGGPLGKEMSDISANLGIMITLIGFAMWVYNKKKPPQA